MLLDLGPLVARRDLCAACGSDSVLWLVAAGLLLVVNLVGLAMIVWDKRQARRKGRRIPERRLLLVALLGGWPLMAFGMGLVRHKTRKPRFLARFWAAGLPSCILLLYLAWTTLP